MEMNLFLAFLKEAKKISIARNPIKRSSEEPPVDNAAPADDADIAQPAPAEDEVSEEDYAPPAG